LVGRIAYHHGTVCTSHKCDDRASMPNVIAEQRDRIVEIGVTGAPILVDVPGAVECRVVSIVEQGDHHIVVGEVIDAHLSKPPTGRPDSAILEMKDLGDSVFYGG
jgi:flavin reductase (DIM6/NTAB) family NADH-FMN oxidoreductase RutF